MATEFNLPELGEGVKSGVVVKVSVTPGDTLAQEQTVLEIETDKAIAEVPSTVSGTVKAIHVSEGDEVAPGDAILTVEEGSTSTTDQGAESTPSAEAEEESAEREGAGNRTANGETKSEADGTERESAATESEADGTDRESGETKSEADGTERESAAAESGPVAPPAERENVVVPAAPSTRRFAREIGVDITQVRGTGPRGRIGIDDVKAYSRNLNQEREGVSRSAADLPDFSQWGEVERRPMSGIRRKTAAHLAQAWTAPHVTQFDKADITDLDQLRQQYAARVERAGGKLTVTAIILKVTAAALKVFPRFNSSIDPTTDEIIYKKYVHIGVAVDTEHGLLVPVIRDVDQKNISELSVELSEVAEQTRQRKLSLEEMQGGCFTVSNLGGIGGTAFTPIINAPEVAILGVARASFEPVYRDERFVPRQMLPLSLSYDHRVIDGADGARFLRWICEALQNPFLLSLEG